jgi:Na+/H+-dicarboxylate symporter
LAWLLGHFYPETGAAMKPFGDGFIRLIKMIIAPIIFCTIVVGIAGMEDMKKVGKTGGLAVLYFEVVSTIALVIGLIVVNLWGPGVGMNVDVSTLDTKGIAKFAEPGKMQSTADFLMNIIPTSVVDAFAKGDMLQVLFFSILFGYCDACLWRTRQAGVRPDRKAVARAVRHRRRHHESGPNRRFRCDGLHHRQARSRQPDATGSA